MPHTLYYSAVDSPSSSLDSIERWKYVQDCVKVAKDGGVKVVKVSREQLNRLAGNDSHEGVVLEATRFSPVNAYKLSAVSENNEYQLHLNSKIKPIVDFSMNPPTTSMTTLTTTNETQESSPITVETSSVKSTSESISSKPYSPVWVAMEHVLDPEMMGEVVRTALHLGVDGVLYKTARAAPPDAESSKANGWHIVGAHTTYGSPRTRPFYNWSPEGVDQPTLLIIGNTGRELSRQIAAKCDSFIQIPPLSRIPSTVHSMGGNVVAGIAMSTLMAGKLKRFEESPRSVLPRSLEEESMTIEQAELKFEDKDKEERKEIVGAVETPKPSKKKASARLSW
ncbi:hypothetical protein BGZ54_001482 [Gamsiella multidivaricata]|nr:hypothetical protein BGZ54_001482 [Gamsiella multidivaricata]